MAVVAHASVVFDRLMSRPIALSWGWRRGEYRLDWFNVAEDIDVVCICKKSGLRLSCGLISGVFILLLCLIQHGLQARTEEEGAERLALEHATGCADRGRAFGRLHQDVVGLAVDLAEDAGEVRQTEMAEAFLND